jgi:EAL domain-containing protein (putative c-di-GMP-specific phosphodiesterase class I)
MQGFLFSKAIPANKIEQLLRSSHAPKELQHKG